MSNYKLVEWKNDTNGARYYDRGEIVTCKDCMYWLKQGHGYPNVCIRDDMDHAYDEGVPLEMDADDFCSRGEKKDE